MTNLFVCVCVADLAFGSVVTLKNHRAGGALLHSHSHLYPKEHPPEQQQVRKYYISRMHALGAFRVHYDTKAEIGSCQLVWSNCYFRFELGRDLFLPEYFYQKHCRVNNNINGMLSLYCVGYLLFPQR